MDFNLDITDAKREKTESDKKLEDNDKEAPMRLITFQRNEIYFNDRKSVMLNLRDITKLENLHETIKTNRML